MIKLIRTKDLKFGMHIVLPGSISAQVFPENESKITSRKQINKIIDMGLHEVKIDTGKSMFNYLHENAGLMRFDHPGVVDETRKDVPGKILPEELIDAINNRNLSARQKAGIVYKASIKLMKNLHGCPSAGNIKEAKRGIGLIVDMVLAQDDIAHRLLEIISNVTCEDSHSVNVGFLGLLVSKQLFAKQREHNMHELGAGFFLHDIGKVKIDPAIFSKPGKLTKAEMDIVKKHPYYGFKILQETDQLSHECSIIVMQHHERVGGNGYPMHLAGDRIHTYGRICSIADVYDSLTCERSYKEMLSPFEALNVMKNEMLHHYHKDVFEKFVLLFADKKK